VGIPYAIATNADVRHRHHEKQKRRVPEHPRRVELLGLRPQPLRDNPDRLVDHVRQQAPEGEPPPRQSLPQPARNEVRPDPDVTERKQRRSRPHVFLDHLLVLGHRFHDPSASSALRQSGPSLGVPSNW